MKNQFTTLKNAKRTSFLIGDSESYGMDTVISEDLGYAPHSPYSFAELNQRKLKEAKEFAYAHGYTNIRIVTTLWHGICNRQGIIDYKKGKTTVMPFDFDKVNEIN